MPLSASHCFICCNELGLSSEVSSFIAWVSSENVSEMSTSFVEDVLSEYDDEIASYLEGLSTDEEEDTTGKMVVFL